MTTHLVSRKYVAVLNGRRALNGVTYSAEIEGTVTLRPETTLYDAVMMITSHVRTVNRDMELVDGIQITIE